MIKATIADVRTTQRQKSSPSRKLKMFENQSGICPLCSLPMVAGEKLIDEHMTSLGLGGSNEDQNRALVHATCAYAKTYGEDGDIAKIAEAKRRKIRHLGLNQPKRKIAGPPRKSPRRPATERVSKLYEFIGGKN